MNTFSKNKNIVRIFLNIGYDVLFNKITNRENPIFTLRQIIKSTKRI